MRSCAWVCAKIAGWCVIPAKIAAAVQGVNDPCSKVAGATGAHGHFSPIVLTLDREPLGPVSGIEQW
jgi:hypothetical protein